MQGVPEGLGVVGAALLFLGLGLGMLVAIGIRRRLGSELPAASHTGRVLTWTVTAALAVGIGVAPFVGWRIAQDLRYTTSIDPWLMERYGVSVFEIHPAAYDRMLERIPPTGTYAMRVHPSVETTFKAAFEQWALTTLLPRRAVTDPGRAGWLITLGIRPEEADSLVVRSWRVHPGGRGIPPSYLGHLRS